MSAEELLAENTALKEKCEKLENVIMGLRFASNNPDVEDAFERRQAAVSVTSPSVGARVKVIHTGSKYAHKDFESVFADTKIEYTDVVENGAMGFVMAKAPHFKKADLEVFLIKFDNNKGAVFARKGIEPAFWDGGYVTIGNIGCKYASQDFTSEFPSHTLVNQCRVGDRGVIVKSQPHYRNPAVTVFLVAVDPQLHCVVMNGKGLIPREIPGVKELALKKEKEEKEAAEKAKKEAEAAAAAAEAEAAAAAAAAETPAAEETEAAPEAEAVSPAKRKAEEPSEDEPAAKKSKDESE